MSEPGRCDLHVHSSYSTDSGNYALRRARLGESYTAPERVYRVCRQRGMRWVTITDHNTLDGALRIAQLPGTFLSVEVTTCFPADDMPLHVLVWGLTEEDHRDLQPYRPSVYELVAFLRERGLAHALAHPLYRMGPPITPFHVEHMMLLFGLWEGRNGARPEEANTLACRLAERATPEYLARLAERHGLEPAHEGTVRVTAGSDDHGALDIATTWTEAPGDDVGSFLAALADGTAAIGGAHGSTVKLAHAVAALAANAYRASGAGIGPSLRSKLEELFDTDAEDAASRHVEISDAADLFIRSLGERARAGGLGLDAVSSIGPRLGALGFASALQAPYLASAHHHAGSRAGLRELDDAFFGSESGPREPRAVVFSDTFEEANGVAGTMRLLAAEGAAGRLPLRVATAGAQARSEPGLISFSPDWALPLPTYELLELRFPVFTDVLHALEADRPDVVHVATPGPVGAAGLFAAKLLGLPLVGSYHTELGPYALHVTRDLILSEALDLWVDWFYRQCDHVLAPSRAVAATLARRRADDRVGIWGRGVDTERFHPGRRDEAVRTRLLEGGDVLFLSVGRLSIEKRLDVLLQAFEEVQRELPGARLVVVGDGPARPALEKQAQGSVRFAGELRGAELATVYASADVFCFSSSGDTFGQVLLEAAASGLPSVAAAAGGTAELVTHGRTGLLVPPDDHAALAVAMVGLARDPALRAELARAAIAAARKRTWDRAHAELRAAYAYACGGARAVRHRRIAA